MNTACRICGSGHIDKKYRICTNMKIMGESFRGGDCWISQCQECGFVFHVFSEAGQKEFTDYYRFSSRTVNYYEVYTKEQTDGYLRHLEELIEKCQNGRDKNIRILDIAGGYGELSLFLMQSGYTDVTMSEIKESCISYASQKGVSVLHEDLLEKKSARKHDIVILSHDLEHMLDVRKAMLNAAEYLKDDGFLILELPFAPMYKEMDNTPYHFLTYEHVCHFSDITVENLASAAGLKIMEKGHYVKCDDYPCIWAILKKDRSVSPRIRKDADTWEDIYAYIKICGKQIQQKLKPLAESRKALILWGIGASTAILLDSAFGGCNVIQLIDKNKARQGNVFEINGRKLAVEPPEQITDGSAAVFILSGAYRASIEKDIRQMGLNNEIMSL